MLGLTSVCIFLFSALALAVTSGYSYGALTLLLASTWLLWKRPRLNLQRRDYLLLCTLLLYFAVFTANMLYHADPAREIDIPLRALLAVPVLLLLIAYPPRAEAWWSGLAIGAITGAALAFYQLYHNISIRPQAATSNAIHYGNVSMLFGVLSLCGLEWAYAQRQRFAWMTLLLVGCLAGIFGSILSGSRGGWIAMPVCLIILAILHARIHGKRYFIITLTLLVGLIVAAYNMPHSPIHQRAATAVFELENFEDTGNVETSVGQRIEMWRNALDMSSQNILLGIGRTGYLAQKQILVKEGKMSKDVGEYTNAHNDYIDALVKRGVTGLLALLTLFLIPLALFARATHHSPASARPFALAGVILLTCYMIFGLTTSSLTLNIGIIMLIFPMVMLWAMLRHQERTS